MEGFLSQLTPFQAGVIVIALWISTTIGTTFLQIYAFRRPALIQKALTYGSFAIGLLLATVLLLAGLGL